jgi:small subunit ribosomal protein S18
MMQSGGKGKGKGKGKFGDRKPREPRDQFRTGGKYTPKLLGKAYFQRKKGCPFSGPKAPKIDYKDVRMLTKYLSDYGKMLPRHLTGVCAIKQRELATAIKRARMLALLSFTSKEGRFGEGEGRFERKPRGDRPGFDRGPREARPVAEPTEVKE